MKKTLLLLVALAALAVPAAAVAKTIEVKGPQAVAGRGFVRAELKMAKTDARGRWPSASGPATSG